MREYVRADTPYGHVAFPTPLTAGERREGEEMMVLNPKSGCRVKVGSAAYRRLVADGLIPPYGERPKTVDSYLYVPENDAWVRTRSRLHERYEAHGFVTGSRRALFSRGNRGAAERVEVGRRVLETDGPCEIAQ